MNALRLEYFTGLVKKSFQQTFSDQIKDRLTTALIKEQGEPVVINSEPIAVPNEKKEPVVVTTAEELEGFYIVRAILRTTVAISHGSPVELEPFGSEVEAEYCVQHQTVSYC